MPSIQFFVAGKPVGQPRVRAFVRGRHAGVYDPGTADDWKACVYLAARKHVPSKPIDGPVKMRATYFLPRPKKLMRKRDPDGCIPHTGKPDGDNLDKAVMDALTQAGMWRDDSQVYCRHSDKWIADKCGTVGAKIAIDWEDVAI